MTYSPWDLLPCSVASTPVVDEAYSFVDGWTP